MRDNPQLVQLFEALSLPARWWSVVVLGLCLGLAGGIVTYEYSDKLYSSETKIFVSPSEIPREFVRSTVTEDMSVRLRSLEEAVLSRSYLTRLVEEVFEVAPGDAEHERRVAQVRGRVNARLDDFDARRGAGLFVLNYLDTDPQRAADVTNRLAELYIEENIKLRTKQAESTAVTLQDLAEEMRGQVELKEAQIAEFRAAHLYELAENLDANLRLLSGRQADLEVNERAIIQAQERLATLRADKARGATEIVEGGPAVAVDPLAVRLTELKNELQRAQARYTSQHPAIRNLESQITEVERQIAAQVTEEPAATPENSTHEIDREIASVEREIDRLKALETKWREDVDLYRSRVEASPRIEQQLAELTKGYSVLSQRYERLESNYQEAKGSLRVEEARKGSQFDVVEKARPAKTPDSPNQQMLYAGGAMAGLLLFVVPFLLRGFLFPRVLTAAGVEALSDVTVLANIDVLNTPDARRTRRYRHLTNIAASLTGVAILVGAWLRFGGSW